MSVPWQTCVLDVLIHKFWQSKLFACLTSLSLFVETKVRKTFQAIVPSVVIVPSATVPSDSHGLSRCNYCRQHSRRIVAALQLTFAFKCSGVNWVKCFWTMGLILCVMYLLLVGNNYNKFPYNWNKRRGNMLEETTCFFVNFLIFCHCGLDGLDEEER